MDLQIPIHRERLTPQLILLNQLLAVTMNQVDEFMDPHLGQCTSRWFSIPVQQSHILRTWLTRLPRSLFCRIHREICWLGTTCSTITSASHFLLSAFCFENSVEGKTVHTTYREKPSIYSQQKIAASNLMYHSVAETLYMPLVLEQNMTVIHGVIFSFFSPFLPFHYEVTEILIQLRTDSTAHNYCIQYRQTIHSVFKINVIYKYTIQPTNAANWNEKRSKHITWQPACIEHECTGSGFKLCKTDKQKTKKSSKRTLHKAGSLKAVNNIPRKQYALIYPFSITLQYYYFLHLIKGLTPSMSSAVSSCHSKMT